jgi:alpha,alpha-trehalase
MDADAGWYFDYDFINDRRSPVRALSALMPLFSGLAEREQAVAVAAGLPALECEHGIAVTEERPGCRAFQWAYPNVWPPLVYVAVEGLRRYGLKEDARRIARTFIDTTDRLFESTGRLWEKTDGETGEVAGGEYEAAPMMGWTAGVYTVLRGMYEVS